MKYLVMLLILFFIETSAPSFENDLDYANRIKEFLPDTRICMTGSHISYLKGRLMDSPVIDFGITKEYEDSALKLSKAMSDNVGYENISGLIYRSKGKVIANHSDSDIDFISLPRPERVITPFYNYNDRPINELAYPSMQVQLSRGCPFKCTFCLWPHTFYGKKIPHSRSLYCCRRDQIRCRKNSVYNLFYVDDDTFNIDMKHLHSFCDALEQKGLNLPWMAMARADGGLDEELIIRMKNNGLTALKFGIESIDKEVLKEINKKLDIKKSVKRLSTSAVNTV